MDDKERKVAKDHRNFPRRRIDPDSKGKRSAASNARRTLERIGKGGAELHHL